MKRLAVVAALVVAGTAGASPVTVLPKPRFNARAHEPTPGPVRFQILSSTPLDPARIVAVLRPHGLQFGGYGFTDEPDYLYAIDRRNGHVAARVLLPTAPEGISRNGNLLTVDTYDRRVTLRITGA